MDASEVGAADVNANTNNTGNTSAKQDSADMNADVAQFFDGNTGAKQGNTDADVNADIAQFSDGNTGAKQGNGDDVSLNKHQISGDDKESSLNEDRAQYVDTGEEHLFGNLFDEGNATSSSSSSGLNSCASTLSCPSTYSSKVSTPVSLSGVNLSSSASVQFSFARPASGARVSNVNASPYSHLKLPDHVILPPPPQQSGIASSSRLTGKFWVDEDDNVPSGSAKNDKGQGKKKKFKNIKDLDDGIEFDIDDVMPSGGNSKSNKRHTRKHPQY